MAFAIGVTGGIGCGKTTATDFFKQYGIEIIDTDEISHELTKMNAVGTLRIRDEIDSDFVIDGVLDRKILREAVFKNPEIKKQLEHILHPMIREEVKNRYENSKSPYCLIVVPLLFETNAYPDLLKRILAIDCDEETQIQRVMNRSQLSREQILAIMSNQVDRKTRISRADDILINENDREYLRQQVEILHEKYLKLAGIV